MKRGATAREEVHHQGFLLVLDEHRQGVSYRIQRLRKGEGAVGADELRDQRGATDARVVPLAEPHRLDAPLSHPDGDDGRDVGDRIPRLHAVLACGDVGNDLTCQVGDTPRVAGLDVPTHLHEALLHKGVEGGSPNAPPALGAVLSDRPDREQAVLVSLVRRARTQGQALADPHDLLRLGLDPEGVEHLLTVLTARGVARAKELAPARTGGRGDRSVGALVRLLGVGVSAGLTPCGGFPPNCGLDRANHRRTPASL